MVNAIAPTTGLTLSLNGTLEDLLAAAEGNTIGTQTRTAIENALHGKGMSRFRVIPRDYILEFNHTMLLDRFASLEDNHQRAFLDLIHDSMTKTGATALYLTVIWENASTERVIAITKTEGKLTFELTP